MIKTEIKAKAPPSKANDTQWESLSPRQYLAFAGSACLVILGVVLYLVFSQGAGVIPASGSKLGNQPALPLASSPGATLFSTGANSHSDAQSAKDVTNLGSSTFNLQNNLPSGQGSAKASPLQPSAGAPNGAQTLD